MSFFFRHIPTVEVNFSTQSTTGAVGEDIVLVSQSIWNALCFTGASELRGVVSIKSKRQYPARGPSNRPNSLTCWAVFDPNVPEIIIPSAWLAAYPTIFQPFQTSLDGSIKSVVLSVVENIALTEVVLTAKHGSAYMLASVHGEAFENWFFESRVIIRDGEDIFIPSDIFSTYSSLTQPALPFEFAVSFTSPYKQGIARRGSTRFIVTSLDKLSIEVPEITDHRVARESLEINESFLISSMLSSPEPSSQTNKSVKLSEAIFSAEALQSPINIDLDEVTIYICASNLHPLGVLNGDWVLVASVNSSAYRLVRIGALDEAFGGSQKRTAMLSPILLHNLCSRGSRQILVRASPYGSRDPGISTAKSMALARVASPFSIHRRYEPLFIGALHEYFGSSKRLVKSGDIISLWINVDRPLDPHQTLLRGDFTRGVMHSGSNVPVFFVVRDVDYEPVALHGEPCLMPHMGCFVDANVTTIIQVGVEQIGVPDVYDYHELCGARVVLPVAVRDQVSQLSNAVSLDDAAGLGVWPTIFISGPRGTGKFSVAGHMARHLQMHLVEINCFNVLLDTTAKTEISLREQVRSAISCSPCFIVLRHVDALGHLAPTMDGKAGLSILQIVQQYVDDAKKTEGKQCIILGTVEPGKIPEGISFSNEIELKALSEEERFHLLLKEVNSQGGLLASDVSLAALAKQTAALVALDLANLVKKTQLCALLNSIMQQMVMQPVISIKHFNAALLKARTTFAQSIGAPSIPTVLWEDVGGLSLVKDEILDTVQLPLDHPELFQDGLKKRSGVLLYGPPGTGKTLLAKAVATSCSLNFFSVKGPELLNMYIGESEANVRRVFQRARDAKPCVIFFDELDSIAPNRGNQGDSGGVMDRIVSQLLAELDGMSVGGMDIFVIGATNRPDLLDPALLRPGRFDRMLYLGVCDTHEAQHDILKALTRKFNLDSNLDLASVAAHCSFNYTGADFYALCADALLHALSCKVVELEKERVQLNALVKFQQHYISPQFFISEMKSHTDLQLVVKQENFNFALEELVPSISNSELLHYISIQKNWHNYM